MIPTEHEYTVATQAAAEKRYEIYVKSNPDQQLPPWSELERGSRLRQTFLENVLPLVDAAISAIPDRLIDVRILLDVPMDDHEFRRAVVKLVEK